MACRVSTVQNNMNDDARRTCMCLTLCLCSFKTLHRVRQCHHNNFLHCKAKRARQHSTAQHTVGADTHTQHLISHLEGACVVDGELAGLRAILFHNGPLPKLDFLISAATHKATAVMQHISAAVTNEKANGQKPCSKCLQCHACF